MNFDGVLGLYSIYTLHIISHCIYILMQYLLLHKLVIVLSFFIIRNNARKHFCIINIPIYKGASSVQGVKKIDLS